MTPLVALVAAALAANPWTSNADEVAAPGWMDEGVLHVSGLSERPLVGGGIARRVSEGGWIGGRFLVPAWGAGPYEGDLFVRGFFTRRPGQIALAVVLLLVYGGVLVGLLPTAAGVSWQGHLGGAIGGAAAAWWQHGRSAGRARQGTMDA